MGFNTGILIINDALPYVKSHSDQFAENLCSAIDSWWNLDANQRDNVDFAIGNCVNGGSVICQDHADITNIIAIGGNYATNLGKYYSYCHHTPEARLEILRKLAKEAGYILVRKQKKTSHHLKVGGSIGYD